jgi:hypothetical protein
VPLSETNGSFGSLRHELAAGDAREGRAGQSRWASLKGVEDGRTRRKVVPKVPGHAKGRRPSFLCGGFCEGHRMLRAKHCAISTFPITRNTWLFSTASIRRRPNSWPKRARASRRALSKTESSTPGSYTSACTRTNSFRTSRGKSSCGVSLHHRSTSIPNSKQLLLSRAKAANRKPRGNTFRTMTRRFGTSPPIAGEHSSSPCLPLKTQSCVDRSRSMYPTQCMRNRRKV